VLSPRESQFLDEHRLRCRPCEKSEQVQGLSLQLLKESEVFFEPSSGFDERLLRKVRIQTHRDSIRYWSPAVTAALIAGVVVFAALQLLSTVGRVPTSTHPAGEARQLSESRIPELQLDGDLKLNR
jgi:hypothetical protein